jgi:alpha-glucosidase
MYVVYNQPLAMLCDSPTAYEKEPEYTKLLASIPTVWKKREFWKGKIGEYVECYCYDEKTHTFYYAGLNGNEPREVEVCLLAGVKYESIDMYVDGPNIKVDGTDYEHISVDFTKFKYSQDYRMKIEMAAGGGYVVVMKCKR